MSTSDTPKVSVLLSSHNGEAYLRHALDSLAAQTFTDWEWVLVDNASSDTTPDILSSYESSFPGRIRKVRNASKLDLADSLNRGLDLACGRYVARMDDDDVAHPERLSLQVQAMERDPDLVLVGASAHRLDEASGLVDEFMVPLDPVRLRIALCWHNPFIHSSVMFRRIVKPDHAVVYPTEYSFAEDYAMWTQLSRMGRVRVLPEKLLTYRKRRGSMTGTGRARQLESTRQVSAWYSKELTAGTPLEGCLPEALRDWIDEPALPDGPRLERVQQIFTAAAMAPFVTSEEKRQAFLNWAEPILDRQPWTALWGLKSGRLFRACGREAIRYALRRAGRKPT